METPQLMGPFPRQKDRPHAVLGLLLLHYLLSAITFKPREEQTRQAVYLKPFPAFWQGWLLLQVELLLEYSFLGRWHSWDTLDSVTIDDFMSQRSP